MTALGGELADYSESDISLFAENRAVFKVAAHGRKMSDLIARLHPVATDLAGLLDPGVPHPGASVAPTPASPAIPTSQ